MILWGHICHAPFIRGKWRYMVREWTAYSNTVYYIHKDTLCELRLPGIRHEKINRKTTNEQLLCICQGFGAKGKSHKEHSLHNIPDFNDNYNLVCTCASYLILQTWVIFFRYLKYQDHSNVQYRWSFEVISVMRRSSEVNGGIWYVNGLHIATPCTTYIKILYVNWGSLV